MSNATQDYAGRSAVCGDVERVAEPFECYRRCRSDVQVVAGHVQFRNDAVVLAPFAPRGLAEAGFVRLTDQGVSLAAARLDGHGDRIEFLNGAC